MNVSVLRKDREERERRYIFLYRNRYREREEREREREREREKRDSVKTDLGESQRERRIHQNYIKSIF